MRKPLVEGLITVIVFFTILFIVRQADWMSVLKVDHVTKAAEERLGNLFWDFFRKTDKENKDQSVNNAVDKLLRTICGANDIDRSSIKLHILDKNEVNAFALPDGHLVIYSGLITASENEEELSGVISHELAHIQMDHVMKKLIKEVGVSLLISASDYPGSGKIQEVAKLLTSTAFDRSFEKEADLKAVDYLINSNMNPVSFANFLDKLSAKHDDAGSLEWISTHPASNDRAAYLSSYIQNKPVQKKAVLTKADWGNLKKAFAHQR